MTSNLPLYKNFGKEIQGISLVLHNQLSQMYTDVALSVNTKIKKNILENVDPLNSDDNNINFSIGDICVRTDTNTAWIMTSRTSNKDVVWTKIT